VRTMATDSEGVQPSPGGAADGRGSAALVLGGYEAIRAWQEEAYRALHENPELPNQEVKTAATAAGALRESGYEVHERVGTTGVVGILRNGEGPVVLVRADMDGLPMKEETGLRYASTAHGTDARGNTVPVAHACGHDIHVASLMAAARLLGEQRAAWHGTFVALFQPAEELGSGAQAMVDGGLGDLVPKPDVALAQHVLAYPAGQVRTAPGPILSTAASVRITVHGRGGHGSMPQRAVDPVVLAASIVVRLQAIVAREVTPGEFAVLTVGKLAAGTKSNIIPNDAVIELNIRAYDRDTKALLLDAIRRVADGESAASGAPRPPDFEVYDEYPLTSNDPVATATVASAFAGYFGDAATDLPRQSASEDFSTIARGLDAPYVYWGVGGIEPDAWSQAEATGTIETDIPANHSPKFAPVIQPTLQTGTASIVVAALAWLTP